MPDQQTPATGPPAGADALRELERAITVERSRFEVIGRALATGNLADLSAGALDWYVDRADRLDRYVAELQRESEREGEQRRLALLGYRSPHV